ncbi:MAG TPA: ABC transporter ATP-binding protein [Vineibacter sp.]|nr:ABC transporter ATP-binding protein [Vineibacter sp.]
MTSPAAAPLLTIQGLSVHYEKFRALDGIDITVGAGEIVSIIGANGAGKSSLLKAIVAQAGSRVDGRIIFGDADIRTRATPAIVAAGIALVPEGRRLFATLTVEENLMIGWHTGRRGGLGLAGVFDLFPVLRDKRQQPAGLLSGGQQQMVALGRALLADPRLLLCDEISLGLAPTVVNDLYELLLSINRQGIGILLVEQDIRRSLAVAHRFYCLLEGRISLGGRPDDFDRDTITRHYFGS